MPILTIDIYVNFWRICLKLTYIVRLDKKILFLTFLILRFKSELLIWQKYSPEIVFFIYSSFIDIEPIL